MVCCYFKPCNEVSWFLDTLENCAPWCLNDGPTLLLGDLNARHKSFQDSSNNTYGTNLVREMKSLGLERLKPSAGRWTFTVANRRSIPDHVLMNRAALPKCSNLIVHEDACLAGAEHRPVTWTMESSQAGPSVIASPRPWNQLRLKDESSFCTVPATLTLSSTAWSP